MQKKPRCWFIDRYGNRFHKPTICIGVCFMFICTSIPPSFALERVVFLSPLMSLLNFPSRLKEDFRPIENLCFSIRSLTYLIGLIFGISLECFDLHIKMQLFICSIHLVYFRARLVLLRLSCLLEWLLPLQAHWSCRLGGVTSFNTPDISRHGTSVGVSCVISAKTVYY